MTLTLRIKKVYFERILSGEKLIEYRDAKPYYDRLLAKPISGLRLHYQSTRKLLVDVTGVSRIRTPEFLKSSGIGFSSYVYAISLANPRLEPKDL